MDQSEIDALVHTVLQQMGYPAPVSGNAATNNTVRNCILTGQGVGTTNVVVGAGGATVGSTPTAAPNNTSIVNNQISTAVFGADRTSAPVSSTKSMHGHLLGATSALEFVISTLAVHASVMPATLHAESGIDPKCELNHVGPDPREASIDHALSFSCGFGGTNVALIVSASHC